MLLHSPIPSPLIPSPFHSHPHSRRSAGFDPKTGVAPGAFWNYKSFPRPMTPEAEARQRIDALLIDPGWTDQNYRQCPESSTQAMGASRVTEHTCIDLTPFSGSREERRGQETPPHISDCMTRLEGPQPAGNECYPLNEL